MRTLLPTLGAAALALAPILASAQTAPLIIDQQRLDRAQPAAPAPPAEPRAPHDQGPAALANPPPGLTIRKVELQGATVPAELVGAASRPFIGKPLDRAALVALSQAIAAAYAKSDIALYTVEAPQQDFAGGLVRMRVIEGYIEHVFLAGPGAKGDQTLVTAYARKLTAQRPLSRASLQRFLSLIRDIPGLKVDANLVAGDQPGAVKLVLNLTRKPVEFSASFDDRGTNYLGRDEITLEADFNSLIRQGDKTRLIFAAPTDFQQFHYYALSQSEPIGSNGLTATGQIGYLETRPKDSPVVGHVLAGSAQLAYPILRSYTKNLYVAGEFDALDSDEGAFGAIITNEHTRVFRVATTYGETGAKRSWRVGVTVSHGVSALGASVDPRQGRADFTKLNLTAGVDKALGPVFALRLRGVYQAASTALPASELFSLGGDPFGRAFPSEYVLGDAGAGGSAELAWIPKQAPPLLKGSELYGFTDGGWTETRSRPFLANADYSLMSVGAGVRLAVDQKAVFTLEAAKAAKTPFEDPTEAPWRLTVGVRGAY